MWAIGCGLVLYVVSAAGLLRQQVLLRKGSLVMFHVEHQGRWWGWCLLAVAAAGCVVAHSWEARPRLALTVVLLTPLLLCLAVIDACTQRLPNHLTASAACLTAAAVVLCGDSSVAARTGLGAGGLGLFYLVLSLASGGSGVGLGDAKLAPTLGALAAWPGWTQWCVMLALPFALAGVWGVLLLLRGAGRSARMPLGPFMIASLMPALIAL